MQKMFQHISFTAERKHQLFTNYVDAQITANCRKAAPVRLFQQDFYQTLATQYLTIPRHDYRHTTFFWTKIFWYWQSVFVVHGVNSGRSNHDIVNQIQFMKRIRTGHHINDSPVCITHFLSERFTITHHGTSTFRPASNRETTLYTSEAAVCCPVTHLTRSNVPRLLN